MKGGGKFSAGAGRTPLFLKRATAPAFLFTAGTLPYAKAGAQGSVVRPEPVPDNLLELRRNIGLNNLTQLELLPIAAGWIQNAKQVGSSDSIWRITRAGKWPDGDPLRQPRGSRTGDGDVFST